VHFIQEMTKAHIASVATLVAVVQKVPGSKPRWDKIFAAQFCMALLGSAAIGAFSLVS
jgi:hypothetical protein